MESPAWEESDPSLGDIYAEEYDYMDYSYEQEEEEEEELVQCAYSDWTEWSSCSSGCGSGVRRRSRSLEAGSPDTCSYREATTSCYGVQECAVGRVAGRASLIPERFSQRGRKSGYEVRGNLKNFTKEAEEEELYCLRYTVMTASPLCAGDPDLASLAAGGQVCGLCTSRGVQHRPQPQGGLCRGSGRRGATSSYRLFLQPECSGTWRREGVAPACDCSNTSTFVFQ